MYMYICMYLCIYHQKCMQILSTTMRKKRRASKMTCKKDLGIEYRALSIQYTDRQTDRQTDKQTDRQTGRYTHIRTHTHTQKHTLTHTYTHTHTHTHRKHTQIFIDTPMVYNLLKNRFCV